MTDRSQRRELLIIIPAYNEEESLPYVLDALEADRIGEIADILVINDASEDATSLIVSKRGYSVISQTFHLGYGNGLQVGYKYAVRRGYKYVIQMDADGQHDVCNIRQLYSALKAPDENGNYTDIVIGSRFLDGGQSFKMNIVKKITIKMFRRMIKLITGRKITDPTTGLQGLNRRAFLYYSKYNNFNTRFPDANMVIQMMLLGFSVKEIPVVMHRRIAGKGMHTGLMPPVIYMFWMMLSIFSVLFRIKILKVK